MKCYLIPLYVSEFEDRNEMELSEWYLMENFVG